MGRIRAFAQWNLLLVALMLVAIYMVTGQLGLLGVSTSPADAMMAMSTYWSSHTQNAAGMWQLVAALPHAMDNIT